MRRCLMVPCLAAVLILAAAILVFAVPAVTLGVEANSSCLDCHGTSGQAQTKQIFEVPPVDRAKCNSCHWYSVHDFDENHVLAFYEDYMTKQCNSCHHASDEWPYRPAIMSWPAMATPYGWFQSTSSPFTPAADLHAIHANGSWLKDEAQCSSCHGAAACDACHGSPDTTHLEHASIGTRQVPTTWAIGKKYGDAASDTYLYSYVPSANYDSASSLYVGAPRAGREQRIVLRFPLARLGPTPVTTATVEIIRGSGAPFPLRAYRLLRNDVNASQATWNVYKTGAVWGAPGAASATSDYDGSLYADSSEGEFDVTALLSAALAAGQTSLDLVIVDPAPVAGRYNAFYSSNGPSSDWYPVLRLEGYRTLNMYAYGPVQGTQVGDLTEPVVPTEERTCVASACHDLTKAATAEFAPACSSCHGADAEHESLHVSNIASDCQTCHQANVQPEHYRESSVSASRGCANCHPYPVDGLYEPWQKGCSQAGPVHLGAGCHDPRGPAGQHKYQDVKHTIPTSDAMCTAAGCHTTPLTDIHTTASVTDSGGTRTGCNVCHTPYTMPSTTDCLTCHPEKLDGQGNVVSHGFDPVQHTANDTALTGSWPSPGDNATYNPPYAYNANCTECHSLLLTDSHVSCGSCHPAPRNTFATWDKNCTQAGCHALSSSAHEASGTAHAMGAADAGGGCGFVSPYNGRMPCHYRDLVQEHNRTINERINPVTNEPTLKVLSVSCVACHNSTAFSHLTDGWDGSCSDCHDGRTLQNHSLAGSARYLEVYAKHNNPSGYYDNGIGNTGSNAMDAHGWVRPNPDPNAANKTIGCGAPTCHTQGYLGGGYPYYTAACSGCHGPSTAIPDPYQGSYSWYSDYWYDDESMDTRLTMTLDPITLPAGSSLDFKTWYDIEQDWDYGYVQVSTDGGTTWTNLPSSFTTNTNPYGPNLGNGITGASGGWVDAHFDLAAYAGQTVRIRFAYVADFYTYGLGWMMDTISVGPPGSPVFYDDVETQKPEWGVATLVTYYDYNLDQYVTEPTNLTGWRRFSR